MYITNSAFYRTRTTVIVLIIRKLSAWCRAFSHATLLLFTRKSALFPALLYYMQLGDYSCGHHVVGIAPQYKSRSSYDILKDIVSEYVVLFYLFIFKHFLVRGAQFIEAGLNGALMKKKKQHTRQIKKKNGATKVWRGLILSLSYV